MCWATSRDMLLAVEQHPAMLLYLDQAQSIGPGSPVGSVSASGRRCSRRGLNENLAREILELHTLGVDGGYGQADVTELARALTGWTVGGLTRGRGARFIGLGGEPGDFRFAERDPRAGGAHASWAAPIRRRAKARRGRSSPTSPPHPTTARHLATKLARHFAGDAPPPALVERLSQAYLQQRRRPADRLPRADRGAGERGRRQPAKFKSPWEWSLSSLRALGTRRAAGAGRGGADEPARPAGVAARARRPARTTSPRAGPGRTRWCGGSRRPSGSRRAPATWSTRARSRRALLPGASQPATAQAIARAESPGQGLALLLVAPEFLRR